jgi:hypothetical protein
MMWGKEDRGEKRYGLADHTSQSGKNRYGLADPTSQSITLLDDPPMEVSYLQVG